MSTTTIRLPDGLKEKIARAAKLAGAKPHNFILEAIAERAELTEQRNDFLSVAKSRYSAIVASGKTNPWVDMQRYLKDKAVGKRVPAPSQRSWRARFSGVANRACPREVAEDFERILDHLAQYQIDDRTTRIGEIIQPISVLEHNPLIGRPASGEMHALVIGCNTHGYVALYCYVAVIDNVFVLAIRIQREAGYVRE